MATDFLVGKTYFFTCAALALLGALGTVTAKNPIRGAMGLLLMILSIGGLFLALHAQFLAAIQLIVYAGDIVVLFLFVIMLLGPSAISPRDGRGKVSRTVGALLFGGSVVGALTLAFRSMAAPTIMRPPANEYGTVDAFGRVLFSHGLAPFELSSALLMVAVIGAVAVARGKLPAGLPRLSNGDKSASSKDEGAA